MISLNTAESKITVIDPSQAEVIIPVVLKHASIENKYTILTFIIRKDGDKKYKISKVTTDSFITDYIAYQNAVIKKTVSEKDYYDPITLASFKTAGELKTKYDSVLWFQHIGGKTFYYVIKGKLSEYFTTPGMDTKDAGNYKMGLVSPDLKEIVPVDFNLVHNIGGTIKDLIEVEKGSKRGLYNLNGLMVAPADYDQIYPLTDNDNIALLKSGDDYFYLKNDLTISDKIVDFKIADLLPKIKAYGTTYTLSNKSNKDIMERNSRDIYTSLVITPSYLVDWQILPKFLDFQNPLRKPTEEEVGDGNGSLEFNIKFDGDQKDDDKNWFESAFYSVVNNYLGGRSGLYTTKNLLIIDKKRNQVLGFNANSYLGDGEGTSESIEACNENHVKAINDSLFEFKTTAQLEQYLPATDDILWEGPYYNYLQIKDGKLVALKTKRIFPTQYIKMDDSYLEGCYMIGDGDAESKRKTIDHANKEILECMENEIYASYHYQFKNSKWNDAFVDRFYDNTDHKNVNVDDSLTAIDKYNINFINKKLNEQKTGPLAAK